MQSDRSSRSDRQVPFAFDARIVAIVLVLGAFAASLNVPYGGVPAALAAFAVLAVGGVVAHLLGERRLRRLTADLVDRWSEAGGRVETVSRSAAGFRTEWTVHTPNGSITVGGLALAPISRLRLARDGFDETIPVGDAERRLESLAEEWGREGDAGSR